MRVNVYAEEMTDRIQIISKEIDGQQFTGLRLYLELPVSQFKYSPGTPVTAQTNSAHFADPNGIHQVRGAFIHHSGDDDSSAVTFWGKRDLRDVLRKMLAELDAHYAAHLAGQGEGNG